MQNCHLALSYGPDQCATTLIPLSSSNTKQPTALALKQAANWQCSACGRLCRRQDELVDDFAQRVGYKIDEIKAHPKRWMLHVTKLYNDTPTVLDKANSDNGPKYLTEKNTEKNTEDSTVVLCGSCHRTYHNYRRWQRHQQHQRQQQEHTGQLTLSDIRFPLAGTQLSLSEWVTPYEIENPLPSSKRIKAPKTST